MDEPSPVGSVDKALVLLSLLGEAGPEGLGLTEIARRSGYTKASVHRLLHALAHRGYAERDPQGQGYRMGAAPARLVETFYGEENLPALLRPALTALSEATEELVHLGMLIGTSIVYLDKVEPERTIRVWSRIGHRVPAARTALGRALLAAEHVEGEALAVHIAAADPAPARPVLEAALARTRARGWAEEVEENEPGISCVGLALVRGAGRPVAVSVTGPSARLTEERRAQIGALLRSELGRLAPPPFRPVAPEGDAA